jgi:hypothetical protein
MVPALHRMFHSSTDPPVTFLLSVFVNSTKPPLTVVLTPIYFPAISAC